MKKLLILTIILTAGSFISPGKSSVYLRDFINTEKILRQDEDTLETGKILKISPFGLDIIPPSAGVQFYRDGIVFLSSTRTASKMLESHTSFGKGEVYYAPIEDSISRNYMQFSSSTYWNIPCEAITFNKDYTVMYFTKMPSGKEPEKIYKARYQSYKNGKRDWISDTKPLSFCSDKYAFTHPALSSDGEKMIFSSNMKESIGGMDLFISYREEEDWSEPINLGNLINTTGNETSPFLDQNNNLFFSSDGIKGFGGYDIYMCRYNGRGWDKPMNLTRLVNTPDDELAFTLEPVNGKYAFYSSRNSKGNRQARLYRITFRDLYSSNKLNSISNALRYVARAGYIPSAEIIAIAEKPAEQEITQQKAIIEKPEPDQPAVKTPEEPVRTEKKPVPEKTQEKIPSQVITTEVQLPARTDELVYRVQFMSVSQSKGSQVINIGGNSYKTFEYFFNGVYRSCIGEFATAGAALNLQNLIRNQGYPDAFIVAFKNNERITGALPQASKEVAKEQVVPATVISKPAAVNLPKEEPSPSGDAVVFRVQYATSGNPSGTKQVTIDGITYSTFEYMYAGAYRLCAGEFYSRSAAQELQSAMRRGQFKDAFIVAFRNGVRITDPSVLK